MRIRDKKTKGLEQALRIALMAETNTAERVIVKAVETINKVKDYKAHSALSANGTMSASNMEEAMVAEVNSEVKEKDGFDKRYEKMCEAMETFSKSLTAMSAKSSAPVSAPQAARLLPTCYKCGMVGHLSNQYRTEIVEKKPEMNDSKSSFKCYKCGGFGHMARNCADNKNKNNEKNNDKLTSENVRGIRGGDERSMKEHPVNIRVQIGKHMTVCLVDTCSEKCVLPGRFIDTTLLEPAECRLFAANGTTINVIGEMTLDMHVGDLTIPTRFVISSYVTEPMLGVNWLTSYFPIVI